MFGYVALIFCRASSLDVYETFLTPSTNFNSSIMTFALSVVVDSFK